MELIHLRSCFYVDRIFLSFPLSLWQFFGYFRINFHSSLIKKKNTNFLEIEKLINKLLEHVVIKKTANAILIKIMQKQCLRRVFRPQQRMEDCKLSDRFEMRVIEGNEYGNESKSIIPITSKSTSTPSKRIGLFSQRYN